MPNNQRKLTEELAIRYNIPLADLESLIITAREQGAKVGAQEERLRLAGLVGRIGRNEVVDVLLRELEMVEALTERETE